MRGLRGRCGASGANEASFGVHAFALRAARSVAVGAPELDLVDVELSAMHAFFLAAQPPGRGARFRPGCAFRHGLSSHRSLCQQNDAVSAMFQEEETLAEALRALRKRRSLAKLAEPVKKIPQ